LLRLLAALLLALSFSAGAVQAQSLDSLRAGGVVGEQFDGYLVLRDTGAPESVRSLVDGVNAKRRQIYGQRAAEQGVAIDQVGRVYAEEIFEDAEKGTWFLTESGDWIQK
jgi:uncharacterized protein YdbL (DUF1318 family)